MAVLVLAWLHSGSGDKAPASRPPSSVSTYYLDCSASQSGNGTNHSPWNSLASASGFRFAPGDRLLLKRGAECSGVLSPLGSGTANAPIVIDAYGSGPAPIIKGGSAEEALRLFNQQYWEINHLEITGGALYGIYVSGDTPHQSLNHIYLRNLNVHGASYTSKKRADSGEVFLSANAPGEVMNDVLIDGVVAHDSRVAEGIFVNAGGAWIEGNGVSQPLGSNVTVENSTAYNVYGDGILIAELNHGLLQANVVHDSGRCPHCTGSTPVGLWEWYCHTCTVQYNESYANQSWGGDGGDFDIDYYNIGNLVQYNYGHDSAGYCIAIFGAGGRATVNSIVRYNVCSHNGRRSDLAKQGEVFIHTWDQGSLDGVQIYDNTFAWNPASNGPALSAAGVSYSGANPRFFRNNIIYSTAPGMLEMSAGLTLDNNLYWTTSILPPIWQVGPSSYASLAAYQAATREDLHSLYANPRLNQPDYHAVGKPGRAFTLLSDSPAAGAGANVCNGISGCSMGTEDFWGNPLPGGDKPNIGAYQGR